VAKAEENLLTYSQAFNDAAWLKQNSTITANTAVAPDGTTTAETLTASAGTSNHIVQQTNAVPAGSNVFSVYLKAGTNNFAQLAFASTSTYANFNLGTGVVGTSSGVTASIVSVGSGWYRCIAVFTKSTETSCVVAVASSASDARLQSWTAAGTETIFIWGAQLEQRSAVTAYTATTTQVITNYVPQLLTAASDVARFEHNPVTRESLGLEIEESRTNLVLRSEDFSLWSQINGSAQSNVIVAPDGTLTADKFVANTTFGQHRVEQTFSLTSGTAYTISVYAKAAECSRIALRVANDSANASFDLVTGTVVQVAAGSNATIAPVGNGWYRCAVTGTATATGSAINARINVFSPANANDWTGNDWNGLYIWGAQVEAGAFPTSYIKTEAAQVTRSADAASMTGTNFSSWYRADEGTLYVETGLTSDSQYSSAMAITDNTSGNMMLIQGNSTNTLQQWYVASGGSTQALMASQVLSLSNTKTAAAYKVNDFAYSTQGAAVSTDTSGVIPVVSQLNIGFERTGNANFFNGPIKKIAYYPARLTNAQLQALTLS
jgi:hypothetical protein